MTKALALVALTTLAACTPSPKPAPMTNDAGCGDTRVAGLIGKVWTESLRADAIKRSGARAIRVIGPETVVTMDYRTDRLNVETDAAGRITRLRCG
ncbi:I78 family peptidase inhibitor [Sphingomonas sp. Leaf21]|uniref:I78 family peptidase inhibitor n=1 Tax=Sphingomonas sp. Leaf21 TaxID=2876550 RepID=UPI001E3BC93A|nr:I78 family peptidase inhibitor [Sphingomonas sp. Leaf21]